MTDIKSMYPDELKIIMDSLNEKPFRAAQLFSWLHAKQVISYDAMTNLPFKLREGLSKRYPIISLKEAECIFSKKDDARKYLWELEDGNVIESVFMRYRYGNTVCVSSQVGCAFGCAFCASTIGGKIRDLTASEMLEQVYQTRKQTGERISNIVVMGSGEPFDNYDNLVRFIKIISNEEGMNLSARSITVSTCGLVPEIYRFSKERLPVTLAVSLHASNDKIRQSMMPIAKRYTISEVINAAKNYYNSTGRRVTFEYALAAGENDSEADAEALSKLLKNFPCHVNLILLNRITEKTFSIPRYEEMVKFQNKLEKNRINVTIRKRMGTDIDGACGQLRKRNISKI